MSFCDIIGGVESLVVRAAKSEPKIMNTSQVGYPVDTAYFLQLIQNTSCS